MAASSCGTDACADGRALTAAGNCADDGAGYGSAANFLGSVFATAPAAHGVLAADDGKFPAIDHDAGELELQL